MSESRVEQLLTDLNQTHPAQHSLLCALRTLILDLGPQVSEEVKHGGILFAGAQPFCGIFAYSRHVSLEFGDGATLADPYGVLEGSGKQRRHIKLVQPADIADKHVAHYLQAAFAGQQP